MKKFQSPLRLLALTLIGLGATHITTGIAAELPHAISHFAVRLQDNRVVKVEDIPGDITDSNYPQNYYTSITEEYGSAPVDLIIKAGTSYYDKDATPSTTDGWPTNGADVIGTASVIQVSAEDLEVITYPSIPVGTLSAFPTIVQTGTHPQLTWDVAVPEDVTGVVDIQTPGTIIPRRDLIMDVRILGAGVTSYNSSTQTLTFVPTETQLDYNGSGYSRIFYGTNNDVEPNQIVHTMLVEEGSTINVGARYYWQGNWGPWFSSTNSNYNVIALKNGDIPPTTTPLHEAPTIESFIRPYLHKDGRIKIGPRDILFLMELTHTDRDHGGWDLQDMAILIGFYDKVNNNNGHGNNEDGVDSSNPGDSPHLENDTDPTVDDEAETGGGKKRRGRRKR